MELGSPNIQIGSPQEFADNAAAVAGGVPNNGIYFTTVSGERILKLASD
jgi:hypothetical protein